MNNLILNSITPLEKRPIHRAHAVNRGLPEAMETIFVLKGFSDGHIHSPIIWEGRYFKPFTKHPNDSGLTCTIQTLCEDPKNLYQGVDLSKYQGITAIYENVSKVRRPISGRDRKNRPIWITKELEITMLEPITGTETKLHLKNVLAWRSGSDGKQPQPANMLPFCVKAIELTKKEIDAHAVIENNRARIML